MVAIHELGRSLPNHEIDALSEYLLDKRRSTEDLSAVKNDILDALVGQDAIPTRLQADMLTIFRDKDYEDWWRDYVVQHFALYYARRWPKGVGDAGTDAGRQEMVSAYWEALGETQTSIAGTALLGVERLSSDYSEFDRSRIGQTAVAIASDPKANDRCRIASVQVAGKMGQAEILPAARKLADSSSSVPLRMSAVAAIGQVGGEEDIEFLKTIDQRADAYTRRAVQSATNALAQRLH